MTPGIWTAVALLSALFACRADCGESPTTGPAEKKRFALPGVAGPAGGCFATDRIMVDGRKVGYMYRERTTREDDTGWRFFAGDESQAYLDDLSHTGIYSANTIANYDRDIIPYLDTPAPCAFERTPDGRGFRPAKKADSGKQ